MSKIPKKILRKIEESLESNIVLETLPNKVGADSSVSFITLDDVREYVIKYGPDVENDSVALRILNNHNYPKVPELITSFKQGGDYCIVTSKAQGVLWEDSISPLSYPWKVLLEIFSYSKIKSKSAGTVKDVLKNKGTSWKTFLNRRYTNKEDGFDWKKTLKNNYVDKKLVIKCLDLVVNRLANIHEPQYYSLIHLDTNDRNIFVNDQTLEITSIIDWTDSIFGDTTLDYARFRLFLTHYYPEALSLYWKFIEEIKLDRYLETLYFLCISLDYIIWYSENESEDQLTTQHNILASALQEVELFR